MSSKPETIPRQQICACAQGDQNLLIGIHNRHWILIEFLGNWKASGKPNINLCLRQMIKSCDLQCGIATRYLWNCVDTENTPGHQIRLIISILEKCSDGDLPLSVTNLHMALSFKFFLLKTLKNIERWLYQCLCESTALCPQLSRSSSKDGK